MTLLKESSTVRELLELFNAGAIKYSDIQHTFNVSRDLIKGRLKTIGLTYDNKAKKFVGNVNDDDLSIPLSELFQKQRGNKSPKVSKGNNASISNNQDNRNSTNIINSNSEVAVTAEIHSLLTVKTKVDRVYRGLYFDRDIANFLDNVPTGNKSEIINKILRSYLKENGLLD